MKLRLKRLLCTTHIAKKHSKAITNVIYCIHKDTNVQGTVRVVHS